MSIESPKSTARVALVWAVTLALLASLFAVAAHAEQSDGHDAWHCAVCFHASHVDKADIPSVLEIAVPDSSAPAAARAPRLPASRIILRAKARAPPR